MTICVEVGISRDEALPIKMFDIIKQTNHIYLFIKLSIIFVIKFIILQFILLINLFAVCLKDIRK